MTGSSLTADLSTTLGVICPLWRDSAKDLRPDIKFIGKFTFFFFFFSRAPCPDMSPPACQESVPFNGFFFFFSLLFLCMRTELQKAPLWALFCLSFFMHFIFCLFFMWQRPLSAPQNFFSCFSRALPPLLRLERKVLLLSNKAEIHHCSLLVRTWVLTSKLTYVIYTDVIFTASLSLHQSENNRLVDLI